MKLKDILDSVEVLECRADAETEISSLCFDSRKACPGAAFVAVRGFKTDGRRFIPAAAALGASVAIVDAPCESDIPYVLVKDCRKALAVMAANFYGHPEKKAKMVGITGTNGKTTVTNLIKNMLESMGHKCGLVGTNGNMIGAEFIESDRTTPESLDLYALFARMVGEGCEYIIMEVSSHSLALDRVYGIEFDAAAFTNLTQDHLDFHKTMEEYAATKALLFDRCCHSVINFDDGYAPLMLKGSCPNHETFSARDSRADYFAENIDLESGGVAFDLTYKGEKAKAHLGIPGLFSVYNAMTAVGCVHALGVPFKDAVKALEKAHGVKGRAQRVPVPCDFTVLLDYAHTPDGVENILKAVRGFAKGRVVALFGCGGDRDRTKRPIMGEIAGGLADFCIVTSDNPRGEEPMDIIKEILPGVEKSGCPHVVIEDRREAIKYALGHAEKDDVIVLMGKGHESYQEIKGVKHHLDEFEEVQSYFKR